MADKGRKIPINVDSQGDDSFEAADAVPVVSDDMDDAQTGRPPIDLDTPIDLSAAVADAHNGVWDVTGTPPITPSPEVPAPGVSSQELDDLKAQAARANDEKLRALADLQNFRRRGEEEKTRIIRDANERLIKELLPVLDDFDLAVSHAKQSQNYEQLMGGVEAILRKFSETLARQGAVPIAALGEPFDPDLHEAVMIDEGSDAPDETVTAELRRGYLLNGRVIRPSLVKVSKG